MTIGPDLVGRTGDPVEFDWRHDDAMLYAVAVGAGQENPAAELAFTTENTRDVEPAVLPTFAAILTRRAQVPYALDMTKVVHAEHAVELAGPLPLSGRVRVTAEISAVLDKGSGALVTTKQRAVAVGSGAPVATCRQTIFVRGAGGFGGDRGPWAAWERPDREPDHRVTCATRPEQALLYRLTGDRNPLHSDPTFAAQGGFDRPILHGMCTYGFAGRVLVDRVCDGDVRRFGTMTARFTKPVLPGDELVVSVWRDDDGASFTVTRGSDLVLDQGRLRFAG